MTKCYLLLTILLICTSTSLSKPHIFGSTKTFICPVTGLLYNITHSTPHVTFHGSNQKLYFSTDENVKKYQNHPRMYWLDPFTLPPPGRDGKRGLPDMHGKNVSCAVDTTYFIVKTMSSSRVMHIGGQCIYFCCQACRVSFWRDPGKYIVNSGKDASSLGRPQVTGGGNLATQVSGFGSTFLVVTVIMTSFLTVLAVFAVSKMYSYNQMENSGWRNVVNRISYNENELENEDEQVVALPSYSDDVMETDEI